MTRSSCSSCSPPSCGRPSTSTSRTSCAVGPAASPSPSPSLARRTRLLGALTIGLLALGAAPVTRAARYEPPGNQVLFGAWFDPATGYSDTPDVFNQRLGQNVPVFQLAQEIPLPPFNYVTGVGGPAPARLIEATNTDAAIFLTVYPATGFAAVATSDFTALGSQILEYQVKYNRTVFLRYAPEMQGTWNQYGQQPTAFNQSWHQMYNAVKAIAPDTIMVWAPNTVQGYPYGQSFAATSAADFALLDTNGDGAITVADDGFAPYYPGDEVVDWIGLSIYYKGQDAAQQENEVQNPGYCHNVIMGLNPQTRTTITPWYTNYCINKPTKACMFAECGAAYHTNHTDGATQAALQQGWLSDCVTNTTFLDTFPRLKLIMQFEYEKFESDNTGAQDMRDYRVTNATAVARELTSDFRAMGTRFLWANERAPPLNYTQPPTPAATVNGDGQTIIAIITATTRGRDMSFPSLFGVTGGAAQKQEFIELGIMMTAFTVGALAVMRYL
ncbi:BZ3500_MvSof-1268-A1-R1_Chr1-3g01836 [Microbotryum saponariae]|uniref:BZ3500_MvSof-1268-A1-R1_Chr1-3g01836 protein n=1 Tax=Microbotryum saponariae TaxID=289078 RepID=A0A2X0MS10_9BASI|nr:BZ3500_MvSof-1268-A1-R1_Chr1-3g01836 [Microbotryum saponariae]SCZ94715.1 BZ3501_MvSof-1269-A2-R1_Chr1-3g01438 [Microbotryum saponariae]